MPPKPKRATIGALIIRIGFWGPLYYDYNKEPPPQKKKILIYYLGPYIKSYVKF